MPNDFKNSVSQHILNGTPSTNTPTVTSSQPSAEQFPKSSLRSSTRHDTAAVSVLVWTVAGVALAACVGPGVGGGNGFAGGASGAGQTPGRALVLDGPVKGAAVYFDENGDGEITEDERARQRDDHGAPLYQTNADGIVIVPAEHRGKLFEAVVTGAVDTATGAVLSGRFISDSTGRVASPLTDLIHHSRQAGDDRSWDALAQDVINDLFADDAGITPTDLLNAEYYNLPAQDAAPDAEDIAAYKQWLISRAALVLTELDLAQDDAVTVPNGDAMNAFVKNWVAGGDTADASLSVLVTRIEARLGESAAILDGKPVAAPQTNITVEAGQDIVFSQLILGGDASAQLASSASVFGFLDPGGNSVDGPASSFHGIIITVDVDNADLYMLVDGRLVRLQPGNTAYTVAGEDAPTVGAGEAYIAASLLPSLVIQPSNGYTGPVTLRYSVFDGEQTSQAGQMVLSFSAAATLQVTGTDGAAGTSAWTLGENIVGDGDAIGVSPFTIALADIDGNVINAALTISGQNAELFEIYEIVPAATATLKTFGLRLKAGESFDYEALANKSFDLTIRQLVDAPTPATTTVTVTIADANDLAPVFSPAPSLNIGERANGTTTPVEVGSISATDPDAGATISYALQGSSAGFAINAASGLITYTGDGSGLTAGTPVTLTVAAFDGVNTETLDVTITVTADAAPVFASTAPTLTLAENATSAAVLGTISATDPEGSAVTYALTGSSPQGFSIDSTSGVISYSGSGFDFEETEQVTLTVAASDATGNTATQNITVSITNIDETPVFGAAPSLTLAENAILVASLGTISATDPEGAVTYRLAGTPPQGFSIDSTSGVISYSGSGYDYEVTKDVTLTVEASDTAGHTITQTVTVSITDINEAPVFSPAPSLSINQNANGETTAIELGTVSATDPEGTTLTYSLAGTPPAGFVINASSGLITYTGDGSGLTAGTPVILTAQASDGTTTATQDVTITVTANAAPVFASTAPSLTLAENATSAIIGTISATDPEGSALTYRLVGTPPQGFSITSSSGRISYSGSGYDYETTKEVTLTVEAADPEGNTTSQTFTISITNVDEDPVFSPAPSASMRANANGKTTPVELGSVSATDPEGSTLSYALRGTVPQDFTINADTGIITYRGDGSELTEGTPVTLMVEAYDGTNRVRQTVTIDVTKANTDPAITTESDDRSRSDTAANFARQIITGDPDGLDAVTFEIADAEDDNDDLAVTASVTGGTKSTPVNDLSLGRSYHQDDVDDTVISSWEITRDFQLWFPGGGDVQVVGDNVEISAGYFHFIDNSSATAAYYFFSFDAISFATADLSTGDNHLYLSGVNSNFWISGILNAAKFDTDADGKLLTSTDKPTNIQIRIGTITKASDGAITINLLNGASFTDDEPLLSTEKAQFTLPITTTVEGQYGTFFITRSNADDEIDVTYTLDPEKTKTLTAATTETLTLNVADSIDGESQATYTVTVTPNTDPTIESKSDDRTGSDTATALSRSVNTATTHAVDAVTFEIMDGQDIRDTLKVIASIDGLAQTAVIYDLTGSFGTSHSYQFAFGSSPRDKATIQADNDKLELQIIFLGDGGIVTPADAPKTLSVAGGYLYFADAGGGDTEHFYFKFDAKTFSASSFSDGANYLYVSVLGQTSLYGAGDGNRGEAELVVSTDARTDTQIRIATVTKASDGMLTVDIDGFSPGQGNTPLPEGYDFTPVTTVDGQYGTFTITRDNEEDEVHVSYALDTSKISTITTDTTDTLTLEVVDSVGAKSQATYTVNITAGQQQASSPAIQPDSMIPDIGEGEVALPEFEIIPPDII